MNHLLFFHSNWKLLPGLDHLSKLKTLTETHPWKYLHWYFHQRSSPAFTWRSQHGKEQKRLESTVNQVPSTRHEEEDRTEVPPDQETEKTNPANQGTGIPYDVHPSQSPTNTTLPNIKIIPYQIHENIINEAISNDFWHLDAH